MNRLSTLVLAVVFCLIGQCGLAQDAQYHEVSSFESYIHAKCREIEKHGRTIDNLTASDLTAELPVGVAREIGNTKYIIAIDSAYRADRGGWFFSAYASVTFPGTTRPIAFAAKNIGFNNGGLTSSSQIKLLLVSEKTIPVNENLTIRLPANGANFVEFDCDGFKSITLRGDFIFSDDILIPDTEKAPGAEHVTASFEISTGDLSNILTSVSITPFKVNGVNDLSFEVRQAVADFSDIVNPSGFIFPQDYQSAYGGQIALWRGFFIKQVSVSVNSFGNPDAERPTFEASNLLIDDLGLSGVFSASNFISLSDGSAGGWPFSVDHLSIKLLYNQVNGGSLKGSLGIPLLGDDPVPYEAMVEHDPAAEELLYRFAIATGSEKEYKTPFSATVTLDKGSIIAMEKDSDGKLVASALLHGHLSVKRGELSVDKIRFENLGLISREPYIVSGDFSTTGNGEARTVGFPVRVDDVGLRLYQEQAALQFDVALNFMNKEDKGFSASTQVSLLARMQETEASLDPETGSEGPRRKWSFEKARIEDIALDCNTQMFGLSGMLSLYRQDPVYGDGFHGDVRFTIRKILKRGIKASAWFGSTETFRYWHVDAYVPTAKIPLVGPLSIDGIMGGASYRMVRQKPLMPDFNQIGVITALVDSLDRGPQHQYVPEVGASTSFLAGVTLIAGDDKVFNADAMLEVAFNKGGGLRYIMFEGTAFFMTALEDRARVSGSQVPKAPVYASLNMLFDNNNDVFHANLSAYLNVAGVLQGTGPNGMMGEAVIHIDPDEWYFYIGRPTQMLGVSIAKLATAQAYFMVGTKIENLPPLPPEVREIAGNVDLSLMRDDMAAAAGKGFAAGVHFKIGFDSKNNLRPFYVQMAVGAGADFMLRNFGNAYCAGRSGRLGINGWYAAGQAYVFMTGRVGVRVRRRNFDIVNLGVAALLQAMLPNPTWLHGRLAGKYRLLGGLVKGKFNLKFTIGDQCEIIQPGSEIDDIIVIADIKPNNTSTDVNVFTAPQVSFNAAVGTAFTMMDLRNERHAYRIALDELRLMAGGKEVSAEITWNDAKDVAMLKTAEILPQKTTLEVRAKIHWEKQVNNGVWQVMKDDEGQVMYETKTSTFTTGTAPDFIPEENIVYSYPIKNQYNLHVNEWGEGYIKLDYGQAYLFANGDPAHPFEFFARYTDSRRSSTDIPLAYDVSEKMLRFMLPSSLSRETVYELALIRRPKPTGGVDENVHRTTIAIYAGEDSEMTTASNTLEGTVQQAVEKDIYRSAFRTSRYGTFAEKWRAMGLQNGQDLFDITTGNIAVIGKRGSSIEAFDRIELKGNGQTPRLIDIVASPEVPWVKQDIAPMLYDPYPLAADVAISWRDTNELGVIPLKAVRLTHNIPEFELTASETASGQAYSKSASVVIGYYVSHYAARDFQELLTKAAARYLYNWSSRPEGVRRLLASEGYPDLTPGQYPVQIRYSLPGQTSPKFTAQVSIRF